jgi:transcriptional regulator GlxA family with amidase domain
VSSPLGMAAPALPREDAPVPRTRRIIVLAVDQAQSLDVLGPIEVFHTAAIFAPESGYEVQLVAPGGEGVALSNRLVLGAAPLPDPPPRHDTLLVAGGVGTREAVHDPALVAWVAAAARRARRTTSVCTGAFLLAEAGVLAGRRATTHWRWCDSLARRHPDVTIDPDAVYVRDGDVWTSAGVTAGIDLALALVEEDVGRDVALAVARELVVFLRRPGGQSQFSRALAAQQATRPALRELQAWIAGHLDADLTVPALAARANLTERSFARAFRREVGETPAAYVEALRVEHARNLLEDGAESLDAVARACGFASAEVLRRAFHRRVGVSPAAYRERFRVAV